MCHSKVTAEQEIGHDKGILHILRSFSNIMVSLKHQPKHFLEFQSPFKKRTIRTIMKPTPYYYPISFFQGQGAWCIISAMCNCSVILKSFTGANFQSKWGIPNLLQHTLFWKSPFRKQIKCHKEIFKNPLVMSNYVTIQLF